jgi:DNA-binding MarR family transcriptional regulator
MSLILIPAIERATHRIGLYLATLREQGLTQGEAHILAHLASSGPATVGELHSSLAHKRSTLTSILDRLAERGYITRESGRTDRRTFVVTLTRSGEPVALRVHRHLLLLEQAVRRKFGGATLDTFVTMLATIERLAESAVSPARDGRATE